MKRALFAALALLSLSLPAWAQPSEIEKARALAGKGRRGEAIELLQKAELDAGGHLLAAGLLAEERQRGRVCHSDAYRSTILDHVEKAIAAKPAARSQAMRDGRLLVVHDTLRWQALLGRSPARPGDVAALLERVTFFGPPQGVYGDTASLDFQPGGRVVGWESVWDEKADMPRRAALSGSYSVEGRKVTIRLGKGKVWVGQLDAQGQLTIEGRGLFTDMPSECDA